MEKKINVCIAGAGGISSSHISILKSPPGRYVNQVCDQALNLIRNVPAVEIIQSRVELL